MAASLQPPTKKARLNERPNIDIRTAYVCGNDSKKGLYFQLQLYPGIKFWHYLKQNKVEKLHMIASYYMLNHSNNSTKDQLIHEIATSLHFDIPANLAIHVRGVDEILKSYIQHPIIKISKFGCKFADTETGKIITYSGKLGKQYAVCYPFHEDSAKTRLAHIAYFIGLMPSEAAAREYTREQLYNLLEAKVDTTGC